jgi:dienelactone hydrolase
MLKAFEERMNKHGNKCTVILYTDGKHGWFNDARADGSSFRETMTEVEKSLTKLGYLKGE